MKKKKVKTEVHTNKKFLLVLNTINLHISIRPDSYKQSLFPKTQNIFLSTFHMFYSLAASIHIPQFNSYHFIDICCAQAITSLREKRSAVVVDTDRTSITNRYNSVKLIVAVAKNQINLHVNVQIQFSSNCLLLFDCGITISVIIAFATIRNSLFWKYIHAKRG